MYDAYAIAVYAARALISYSFVPFYRLRPALLSTSELAIANDATIVDAISGK